MANKRSRVITEEEYKTIIKTIRYGFTDKDGVKVRENPQVEFALQLQANIGLRISDAVNFSLGNIKKDGSRMRLDIVEKKTGKRRDFTLPIEVYTYIQDYAIRNSLKVDEKLIKIGIRQVQNILKRACESLEYEDIGTHSFRKFYATQIYNNNNHNIELCRHLLMHSNIQVTQKYIGVSPDDVESAIMNNVNII